MTTVRKSLRSGWKAAVSRPRLAMTVWLWGAALGLSAALPVWRWLSEALGPSAESARALERFSLGLFTELVQYDRFSPLLAVRGEMLALAVLGILSNPLIAAGVLEVIVSVDDRPLLHRFMRGAGRFYGRFLRLLALAGAAAVLLFVGLLIVTGPIVGALDRAGYERAWLAAGLTRMGLLGLAAALVMIVTDVARASVAISETDVRGMTRAWIGAARFVLRHFGTVMGSYAGLAALMAAALAVYFSIATLIPAVSWAGIVAAFAVQQAFMIARAGLRVMRAGVAVSLARADTPRVTAFTAAVAAPRAAEPREASL